MVQIDWVEELEKKKIKQVKQEEINEFWRDGKGKLRYSSQKIYYIDGSGATKTHYHNYYTTDNNAT